MWHWFSSLVYLEGLTAPCYYLANSNFYLFNLLSVLSKHICYKCKSSSLLPSVSIYKQECAQGGGRVKRIKMLATTVTEVSPFLCVGLTPLCTNLSFARRWQVSRKSTKVMCLVSFPQQSGQLIYSPYIRKMKGLFPFVKQFETNAYLYLVFFYALVFINSLDLVQ